MSVLSCSTAAGVRLEYEVLREDSVGANCRFIFVSSGYFSRYLFLTLSQGNATLHLYPHFRPLLEFKGKPFLLVLASVTHNGSLKSALFKVFTMFVQKIWGYFYAVPLCCTYSLLKSIFMFLNE